MLSCSCYDEYEYYVEEFKDGFQPLDTKRRKRCYSCKKVLEIGEVVLPFRSYRRARSYYEECRFDDEVPLANKYLCEHCGEIWLNLNATGLCVIFGDMNDALKEYWEMTGFKPAPEEPSHARS